MASNMVFAMLIFGSLALVINCSNTGVRDAAGGGGHGQFSDSFHQVLDCSFGSSLHQEDHITWEMSVSGFNTISATKMALTFQDLYGNSTLAALSVCDLISNQRVLVIICTLTSYEASLIAGIDDFMTKVPTPCGEPALPKAKLQTASSVMYMVRHTPGKVSCFSAVISSFNWQNAFIDEDIKFHRDDIDIVTLNLTSLATNSRKQKLLGLIEMDEASRSRTSFPLQWTWSNDIGCKGALIGTDNTFQGNYRRQEWDFPTAGKAMLRIGVPVRSNITHFVSVNTVENHRTHITGFSIDVFEAAVRHLPYKFTYKLIPFDGSSDELVKKVARKIFDVAVGDIVITADHHRSVEFSQPYLEPGFMMIVKTKTNELNNFWWFLSPFTSKMWVTLAALNIFIGAVISIIEGQYGDRPNLIEALFFLHREPLRNNASRLLKFIWVSMVLLLAQIYSASLTSRLTVSQQEPSVLDANSLKWTNAAIGCDGQSQTISYLVKVLGFKRRNIRVIASIDDYAEALSSENIKAAFLLTPYAKVFLAKHCADFTEIKSTYGYNNLGGFGFVFPKGSPLADDISAAILELEESGELQLMEEEMSSFSDCSEKLFEDTTIRPIGPSSFKGLFLISGGASSIALLITLMSLLNRHLEGRIRRMIMGRELWLWLIRIIGNRRINQLQVGE
ncbi:hypothetical protein REPUB_Repub10bG0145400 [Reevesia pubescens]